MMSKPSLLSKVKSAGALKSFVTATVAEVLNPKTALFFLAFFPHLEQAMPPRSF
ncbi:hypothetical protein [Paenibacillus sp.]|uniref:hypothetical protein n=1 Tax=Paenibacillus sp. TaxID=58172 RepID=UPI0037CA82B2